jgi:hypothetical protein
MENLEQKFGELCWWRPKNFLTSRFLIDTLESWEGFAWGEKQFDDMLLLYSRQPKHMRVF